MEIANWKVEKIIIDGEEEYSTDGSFYSLLDFLKHTETIEYNKLYMFGFTRNLLCKVVGIVHCDIYLETIADLDTTSVVISDINGKYTLEVE